MKFHENKFYRLKYIKHIEDKIIQVDRFYPEKLVQKFSYELNTLKTAPQNGISHIWTGIFFFLL